MKKCKNALSLNNILIPQLRLKIVNILRIVIIINFYFKLLLRVKVRF